MAIPEARSMAETILRQKAGNGITFGRKRNADGKAFVFWVEKTYSVLPR